MKISFFIKDILTNEFYWRYRINEGFTENIKEATSFNSKDEAIKELQEEYLKELFSDRLIQIIDVYSLSD